MGRRETAILLRKNDLNTIGKEVDGEVLGQELRVPDGGALPSGRKQRDEREDFDYADRVAQSSTLPFTSNKAAFYEWNEDRTEKKRSDFDVPNAMLGFFHDILVTENWYCLFQTRRV